MLGFYDYTVILTYLSLIASVCGIACAKLNHPLAAIFCLLFCGLCDMFDGKVARTKRNRTEGEKRFGIQIDSLCDLICFGVLPAMICMEIWGENVFDGKSRYIWVAVTGVCCFYVLAGLIRLAFFNVTEELRQQETDAVRSRYQGLPITSAALILPVIYIFRFFIPSDASFRALYTVALLITGVCFITPFRIRKPKMGMMLVMLGVGIMIAVILLIAHFVK